VKKTILLIVGIWTVICFISLFLPIPTVVSTGEHISEIDAHLSWIINLTQSVFNISAGIIMFRAIFFQSQLGGILGATLRLLAVGFLLSGIAQIQVLIVSYLNVWTSWYVLSPWYMLVYSAGPLIILCGQFVSAKRYVTSALITLGIVTVCFAAIGVVVSQLTPPIISYKNLSVIEYQASVWIDVLMVALGIIGFVYSIFLARSFGESKFGRIFTYLVFPNVISFPVLLISFYYDTQVWSGWYLYMLHSGLFFIPGAFSAIAFFYFALRLRYVDVV
jgi:hypothetical protein